MARTTERPPRIPEHGRSLVVARLTAVLAILLFVPGALLAQTSGQGRYATFNDDVDEMEMPDGGTMVLMHYRETVFADASDNPLDGLPADCVGQFLSGPDGGMRAASGTCFGHDGKGNGVSYWFRMDAAGTADCPDMCGSYGYFAGYGKYAGIRGQGTWRRESTTATGGHGSWKGTYQLP
jgi:hypothetical protein